MEYTLLIIFLTITSSQCLLFTKEQEDHITEIVELTMDCHHIPGLALSVVKGSSSWTKGFGTADFSTGRSVQSSTLFASGSLGKAFTMTLLAMLLNETSYTWSTKVSDIEGINFTFINETLTREATLADLLSHQTGLWDVVDFGFIAGYPQGTTRECLSSKLKYLPQKFGLRADSFQYNNMMYMLLGHVAEVLGKDSWENLIVSRIFEPLGMMSSKIMSCPDDVLIGNVAKPYIKPKNELQDGTPGLYKISPLEPAGGLLTSADDMMKWLQFNLQNGTSPNGKKLVNPDLFAEAFKNHRKVQSVSDSFDIKQPEYPINDLTTGYGYAWFTSSYRGLERIWHSGGLFSYVSTIWLFFEEELGIYINLNGPGLREGPSETITVILSFVSDIALGLQPWLNTTTACSYPAPWRKDAKIDWPSLPVYTNDHLEDFIGTYGNPLLPDITVSLEDATGSGTKKLKLLWNRIKGDLLPTESPDMFNFKMTDPWEYAIETMLSDNLSLLFPINFSRGPSDEVHGFDFSFGDTAIMKFEKKVRFADGCKLWSKSQCEEEQGRPSSKAGRKEPRALVALSLLIGGFALKHIHCLGFTCFYL